MKLAVAAAAALVVSGAQVAECATVTFTDITKGDVQGLPWIEDGVTVTATGYPALLVLGYHDTLDTLHLDDSGSAYARAAEFTTGGMFSATSFDILPTGNEYCSGLQLSGCGDPFENVEIEGYLGSDLIASVAMFMGTTASTYLFGPEFSAIDRLIISTVRPEIVVGGNCFAAPCAHFSIDNVTLSPVPLPASAWLLMTGLAGLFLRAKLRRSSS